VFACSCVFFSSSRRHTRSKRDWRSDVCSSDLDVIEDINANGQGMLELNLLQNNQYADGDNDSVLVDLIKVEDPQAENRGLSGATDGSNFTNVDNKFDFVIYGPGRIDSAHTIDESIEVDQYLAFIDKYVNIYKGYLK